VPTLKFSAVVQNSEFFAWKKLHKILKLQSDLGTCYKVIITQQFSVTYFEDI